MSARNEWINEPHPRGFFVPSQCRSYLLDMYKYKYVEHTSECAGAGFMCVPKYFASSRFIEPGGGCFFRSHDTFRCLRVFDTVRVEVSVCVCYVPTKMPMEKMLSMLYLLFWQMFRR